MITYIIGTDTDSGKTYYGKSLATSGKTVIKPIETGRNSFNNLDDSDSYTYSHIQKKPIEEINCYFFNEPASPHFASALDGVDIDIDRLKAFIQREGDVFVELAGGLMVPITKTYTQLDWIKETKGAAVHLVVGNKLGCLNHSLLTIELLKCHHIAIDKIIINNLGLALTPVMQNNIDTLKYMYGDDVVIEVIE